MTPKPTFEQALDAKLDIFLDHETGSRSNYRYGANWAKAWCDERTKVLVYRLAETTRLLKESEDYDITVRLNEKALAQYKELTGE